MLILVANFLRLVLMLLMSEPLGYSVLHQRDYCLLHLYFDLEVRMEVIDLGDDLVDDLEGNYCYRHYRRRHLHHLVTLLVSCYFWFDIWSDTLVAFHSINLMVE